MSYNENLQVCCGTPANRKRCPRFIKQDAELATLKAALSSSEARVKELGEMVKAGNLINAALDKDLGERSHDVALLMDKLASSEARANSYQETLNECWTKRAATEAALDESEARLKVEHEAAFVEAREADNLRKKLDEAVDVIKELFEAGANSWSRWPYFMERLGKVLVALQSQEQKNHG